MDEQSILNIIIRAQDQASAVLKGIGGTLKGVSDGLQNGFKAAETGSYALLGGIAAVGAGLVAFGLNAASAYNEAAAAQAQLEHAVIGVSHATRQQLQATMDLADALEKKGVLDGDNIKVGLAQLSTFGLTNKAVQALGGSLADLAVNQFGVNASGDQLAQSANMIAKALNGQFGVLEKSGIRFTDAQKHMIQYGTEMQKVKAINEGFAQNLKMTNDVAMQTGEGLRAHLNVQLGNIQETIGKLVSDGIDPLLRSFSTLIDDLGGGEGIIDIVIGNFEKLVPLLPMITAAILFGLLPAFVSLAGAALTTATSIIAPLLPFLAIGAAVGFIIDQLVQKFGGWDNVMKLLAPTIDRIKTVISGIFEYLQSGDIVGLSEALGLDDSSPLMEAIDNIWLGIWKVKEVIISLGTTAVTYIGPIVDILQGLGDDADEFYNKFGEVANSPVIIFLLRLRGAFDLAKQGVQDMMGKVVPIIQQGFAKVGEIVAKVIAKFEEWRPYIEEKLMPAINHLVTQVGQTLGDAFRFLGDVISQVWQNVLAPAFDWISQNIGPILDFIIPIITEIIVKFLEFGTYIFSILVPVLQALWDQAVQVFTAIAQIITFVWSIIQPILQNWWNFITGFLIPVLIFLWNESVIVWNLIVAAVQSAWSKILQAIQPVIDWIKTYIMPTINVIKDGMQTAWDAIAKGVEGLWSGISGGFKSGINGIIDQLNGFIDKINDSLKQFSDLATSVGSPAITYRVGHIPKLAQGTNYVPHDGLYFLHEAEAVQPKKYNPAAGGITNNNSKTVNVSEVNIYNNMGMDMFMNEINYNLR